MHIYFLMVTLLSVGMACSTESNPNGGDMELSHDEDVVSERPSTAWCEPGDEPSDEVILRIKHEVDPGRLFPGHQVFYDHGIQYLLVDDRCHYRAFHGGGRHGGWGDHVRGQLDAEEAATLLGDLGWDRWPDEDEDALFVAPGVSHAMPLRMSALGRSWAAVCDEQCPGEKFAPWHTAWELVERLAARGAPVEPTALRYLAVAVPPEQAEGAFKNVPPKPMPADFKPKTRTFTQLEDVAFHEGARVSDESVVAALWELRREHLSLSEEQWWYVYIPLIDEQGQRVHIHFRPELDLDIEEHLSQ